MTMASSNALLATLFAGSKYPAPEGGTTDLAAFYHMMLNHGLLGRRRLRSGNGIRTDLAGECASPPDTEAEFDRLPKTCSASSCSSAPTAAETWR